MKKIAYYFSLFALISIMMTSCEVEPENDKTPAEQFVGKWTINTTEILAQVIPGDGSYLIFNECSAECFGEDYLASDKSAGTFSYQLNEDATILSITDESGDGGSYNADWEILKLTDDEFRMITDTGLFGTMKIEMTKEK